MNKILLTYLLTAVLGAGIYPALTGAAIIAPGEDIFVQAPLPMEEVSGARIYNPPVNTFNFKVEIEGVTTGTAPRVLPFLSWATTATMKRMNMSGR